MRSLIFVSFLSAVIVTACAPKPPAERFYGEWLVKAGATLALDPEVRKLKPNARTQLQKVTQKWMQSIRFKFDRAGILTVVFNHASSRYLFKVEKVGPNDVTLTLHNEDNTPSEDMVIKYRKDRMLVSKNNLRWVLVRK